MEWNFDYLFKTEDDYNSLLESVKTRIDNVSNYEGKLSDESLLHEMLVNQISLDRDLLKCYQYASLKSEQNKKDLSHQERVAKIESVFNNYLLKASFIDPELISLGKDYVLSVVNKYEDLSEFKFQFEKLFRNQDHILDSNSERLLGYFRSCNKGSELYAMLSIADTKPNKVVLSNGEKVETTVSNFYNLICDSKEASDRKTIFESIYKFYEAHKNSFSCIYDSILENDKATYKARNYQNSLESHLYSNNIPTSVYRNLVKVAGNNTESLKKYLQLKKEYLKLDEYHTYDRFLELSSVSEKYSYEEAKDIFFKSIEKFPEDFKIKAKMALEDGFVDVYPKDGKTSGAFSSGMPDLRPYILLNFTNSLDDIFTVAHEAGHSIHSLYAMEAQKTNEQNYTIFVAEIASTFNEHNLLDYFMNDKNSSKEVKIRLLQKAIDSIMSTFYRQTLFAEYELIAHEMKEQDKPINYQVLNNIMKDLYMKYYGLDLNKEPLKEYVWAYIPHLFNTPFYVYQYATSFAASFKLYKDVCENFEVGFKNYTNLLKSGGSKYPVTQALEAGVDFTKEEAFMAVIERMDYLVDELEKLLNE